ncbi:MAG: hypothetical protein QOE68_93, partial [Thermoanaerobaculia bacterium]|nr:hypothetical protein [Thermoanaerobaculia bacterium]
MIECLVEPHSSAAPDELIDSSCRDAFDAFHHLGERVRNIVSVMQQCEDEMDVVR